MRFLCLGVLSLCQHWAGSFYMHVNAVLAPFDAEVSFVCVNTGLALLSLAIVKHTSFSFPVCLSHIVYSFPPDVLHPGPAPAVCSTSCPSFLPCVSHIPMSVLAARFVLSGARCVSRGIWPAARARQQGRWRQVHGTRQGAEQGQCQWGFSVASLG